MAPQSLRVGFKAFKVIHEAIDREKSVIFEAETMRFVAEENLICTLNDFLMGSADTTSGTLAYACLWLMLHPDVQERCYQEIVTVVGKDRLPQVKDREMYDILQS